MTQPPLDDRRANPMDLEFWARPAEERDQVFERLRREEPVAWFPAPDRGLDWWWPLDGGYHAVTRYRDVVEISRDARSFSSARGSFTLVDQDPAEHSGDFLNLDDPRHARLRRVVSSAFTPRTVAALADQVSALANDVIDDICEQGSCDFVEDLAVRLPLEVICTMLGVPPADHDEVFAASNLLFGANDPEFVDSADGMPRALIEATRVFLALCREQIASRRADPGDDLLTAIVTAEVDGERLTDAEIVSFFTLLVTAGNETTRNAIAHGLLALTHHPDQRAVWQADVDGVSATAVDEIVRWASPVIWMRRTVTTDVELSGRQLRPGDRLILFYGSANRDHDQFADPYRFDVRRHPNSHLGFGAPGSHFCLGAHLARREISVVFRELFRRLPDIEASGEPQWLRSNCIQGIKHLPCSFTPSRRT